MQEKNNTLTRFFRSVKNLFIRLFGFGKMKEKDVLREEELMGPFRQIIKKFLHNKLGMLGLGVFIFIILFVAIGSRVINFKPAEKETSQLNIAPGRNYLNVPSELKKSGIKAVENNGETTYLIEGGIAFTIAIGNNNKIYVWGSNINKIKKVPQEIQERAKDIVQLSVGSSHAVALTNDGQLLGWGKNNFDQTRYPIYDPAIDSTFGTHKKTIQAYFDSSVRTQYASDVITTIEDDPIIKVSAGYEYTSILTQSGVVYTWGSTKSSGLSDEANSYKYYVPRYRVGKDASGMEILEWRYSGSSYWRKILTAEEVIEKYNLVKRLDDPIVFKYRPSGFQWKYYSEEESAYRVAINAEELSTYINISKIVDIEAFDFNLVFKFADGSYDIGGVSGDIIATIPKTVRLSSAERGYEIKKIVLSLRNAVALTDKGDLFGWGEVNAENNITRIPNDVQNSFTVNVSAGTHHIITLDDNGNVRTWGYKNTLQQLNIPKKMNKQTYISASYFNNVAVNSEGSVTTWGHRGYRFGTDAVGADNFKRVIAGGTMTLSVAAVAVVVSLIIGLLIGLISGFYGGWIDNILMRFGEIISAFPFLPLAMILAKLVEENPNITEAMRVNMIMVILGFLSWPGLSRLIRGQILAEREKDFVLAAKSLGIKERHIITRHILPNVINVVIVNTTLAYAGTLLTEAGLSYLGFGVKYPNPSWGNLLTGAQDPEVIKVYWWRWIIPAIFLIVTALSINLVGDGLREAMDPKSNER